MSSNTFQIFLTTLEVDGQAYKFYDVPKLHEEKYGMLIDTRDVTLMQNINVGLIAIHQINVTSMIISKNIDSIDFF